MTSEQYAPAVLQAGVDLGITPKGIVIGFATVYVESNWRMYANAAVPDSMSIPHDAVGSDGYSVGLFQQQVVDSGSGWWWGDAATCMDPYKSAQLFFSRLANLDYNSDAQSPGSYAQAIQQSAFPDRYDQRMADAQTLYNRLVQPAEEPVTVPAPGFNYQNWVGRCPNHQYRQGTRVDLVLLHTEEGAGDAMDLANFLIGSANTGNPVSYHRTIDNAVNVVDVVDMTDASWSVMNSNNRAINMCFAGSTVNWSRDEWLANMGNGIDVAAYLTVLDCRAWGIPFNVIAPPYNSDPPGISDHRYCSEYLRDGNSHSDVGDHFPWDVFAAAVARYAGTPAPAPAPPPTQASSTYTVCEGDNLSDIADRFGTTISALMAANPQIGDPNLIFPGQVLVILGN